jgi:hypothetical protein
MDRERAPAVLQVAAQDLVAVLRAHGRGADDGVDLAAQEVLDLLRSVHVVRILRA